MKNKRRILSKNYYVKLETGFGYVSRNTIGVYGAVGKLEEATSFTKKEAISIAELKVKQGTYAEVHYVEAYVTVVPVTFLPTKAFLR